MSPLYADLAGLPPLLIQVGDRETVLDDSIMFADKARAAGVDVELQVWDGMIHVFQMFGAELAEAHQAIACDRQISQPDTFQSKRRGHPMNVLPPIRQVRPNTNFISRNSRIFPKSCECCASRFAVLSRRK